MTISKRVLERLGDRSLAIDEALVGGRWVGPGRGGTFDVVDPSTGEVVAAVPDLGRADCARAIEAADVAQRQWCTRTAKDRAAVLRRLHELVLANVDDLAALITCEMGKLLPEARDEVRYGASYFEWFAEEAKRANGDTIPTHRADGRISVIKQPIGVVAAITPWNFPDAVPARKLVPALAAGCAPVSKPAEEAPLSALALAQLAERAGLPPPASSASSRRATPPRSAWSSPRTRG